MLSRKSKLLTTFDVKFYGCWVKNFGLIKTFVVAMMRLEKYTVREQEKNFWDKLHFIILEEEGMLK